MSPRIALIINPRSHAVATRGAMLDAAADNLPGVHNLRLDDFDKLAGFTRQISEAGVDKVFVEGGDGTVLAALSACLDPGSGYETPPDFAVLPGGSTNLAARCFGFRGKTKEDITRRITALATKTEHPIRETHCAMRIQSAAQPTPTIGFVLSTGTLARAMLYTQREFHGDGQRGSWAVATAIIRFIVAPGKYHDTDGAPVLRGSPLRIEGTGATLAGDHTLSLISSLPRLSLGLKPFWGTGDGGLRLTHAAWPMPGFRRAITKILLNLSGPGMIRHAVTSHRSDQLSLQYEGPIVIDGEAMDPAKDGRIDISTTQPLGFLR